MTLLVHGSTVEMILEEAADLDLIAVDSHGRGAKYKVLMGSVSEEIIHKYDIRFSLSQHKYGPDPTMESVLLFRCLAQSYDDANLEQK